MNSSVYSAGTPADFFSLNNGIYYSGHDGPITVGSGNGSSLYLAWGTTGQSAHVINVTGAIGLNTSITGSTNFGTSGQVLTSGGSAATPTWTTPATGTVTSVSATAPVTSSGGATPNIAIPAATTAVSGYLTSTDWTTFNSKGSGTVTSITSTTLTVAGTSAIPTVNLTSGIATAGTTGSATLIPVVTIDTYGRVTSITTAANPQGTVTSVAATVPSFLSVSGSPITSSGTLAITLSGTALPIANGGTGTTSTQYASLTANVTGTLPIANGGTNSTATATAGGVGYGTGTAHAYTSAGTSGQVLTSAGTGTPTWSTPSAGAMTLISTQTASSSIFTWTGLPSTYGYYLLIFNNVIPTNNTAMKVQIGVGATPTYITSGYQDILTYGSTGATQSYVIAGDNSFDLNYNAVIASGIGINGYIYIANSNGKYSSASGETIYMTSGSNYEMCSFTGYQNTNTSIITAIKFLANSGSFTSGTASLYGISS